MRRILALFLIFPGVLMAQDFQGLGTDAIRSTLNGRTVAFDGATQQFLAEGRTLYDNGSQTWGKWKVEDGQYCSQWPHADGWTCYRVEQSGDSLRFVGTSGTKVGRLE